jgi:hypothetical protein
VHKLVDDLNAGKGTAGQLLKNEDLSNQLKATMTKIDSIIDKVASGQGTIGQLLVNQQLYDNLNGATREMHLLMKDFRANPKKFLRIKLGYFRTAALKYLIPNADDFGYTRDVNDGIIHAHRQGILTATTLMATGAAFDHAVALARQNPGWTSASIWFWWARMAFQRRWRGLRPRSRGPHSHLRRAIRAGAQGAGSRHPAESSGYAQAHAPASAGAGRGCAHRVRVSDPVGAPSVRPAAACWNTAGRNVPWHRRIVSNGLGFARARFHRVLTAMAAAPPITLPVSKSPGIMTRTNSRG